MPTFLADHVEQNNLQGKLRYSLFVGASSGAETENRWASLDMIQRRSPHQVGKAISKGINDGSINFFDKHLSMFPSDLVYVRPPTNRAPPPGTKADTQSRASTPRTGPTTRWMWPWLKPVASSPMAASCLAHPSALRLS